jgi:hypothetical protein
MRAFLFCLIPALAMSSAALAQPKPAKPAADTAKPKPIGKFEDWQAATHVEGGQLVCYAFTRVQSSVATPAVTGRTEVVLTVTHRPTLRDAVAISVGFTYLANAAVVVQADAPLDFYTAQRSAFARDGHAAVVAFQKIARVVAKSPGPRSGTVTDIFSTKGFTAAYAAINKACPAK